MRRFVLPSLLAAGFTPATDAIALGSTNFNQSADKETELSILNYVLPFQLAGHSSHRSHSSHGSHRSSSGGGGSYVPPSPPSPGISTSPGGVLPKPKIKPGSEQYSALLIELQACLYALNYYRGPIDGLMGPKTKVAISKAQKQIGVAVTGDLDETLIKACRLSLK